MAFDHFTLSCFLSVAETGSFTKAAREVNRTQSAVSQQIAKLEAYLGVILFHRGNRLTLTSDGEIFQGYAKPIVRLHREAYDRFREPKLEGNVRFGLPEDFASVFLADVLAEFGKIHPRVLLHVECDFTLNLFARFKKKEFDLVLVKMSRPEDFPNGQDVWSEPLEWVGELGNSDKNEPIPLVLSPQPCVYRSRAIQTLERAGMKWRVAFSSPSYTSTVAAVKAGMGLSVLPRNMVPKEVRMIRADGTLPALDDTHISLLKHSQDDHAINTLERFVMKKMQP